MRVVTADAGGRNRPIRINGLEILLAPARHDARHRRIRRAIQRFQRPAFEFCRWGIPLVNGRQADEAIANALSAFGDKTARMLEKLCGMGFVPMLWRVGENGSQF